MVTLILVSLNFWWAATQSSSFAWLAVALVLIAGASMSAWLQIGRAVHEGRRLRAAASGATIINPPAQRTPGRHRA
jgi:hypothetical protein